MGMLLSLLVMCLSAAPLPLDAGHEGKVVGWSSDGRYLVWTFNDTAKGGLPQYSRKGKDFSGDPMKLSPAERAQLEAKPADDPQYGPQGDLERVEIAVIYDVITAERQEFLLKDTPPAYRAELPLRVQYAKAKPAGEFDAWKQAHTVGGTRGMSGPGRAKVDVSNGDAPLDRKNGTVGWSRASCYAPFENCESLLVLYAVTHGERPASWLTFTDSGIYQYHREFTAEPIWDPSGKRVAFVVTTGENDFERGDLPSVTGIHLLTVGPTVELLSSVDVKSGVPAATVAVEGAGAAVTVTGDAQKARPTSVVYASAALGAVAKKLAAAIPGGATVEPLTWKAHADLVVALGSSAK